MSVTHPSEFAAVHDAYLSALGARQLYERVVLNPALDEFDKVRAQFPSDGLTKAQREAPDLVAAFLAFEPVEAAFDALDNVVCDATEKVLQTPAANLLQAMAKFDIGLDEGRFEGLSEGTPLQMLRAELWAMIGLAVPAKAVDA